MQYRSSKDGNGIDLTIKLSGDLITEPSKTFVGNEFVAQYDEITEFIYKEFFTTEVKTITQAFADNSKVKGIITDYMSFHKIEPKKLLKIIDSTGIEILDNPNIFNLLQV